MKKIIFTQSGANENVICLKDIKDNSIVGVQYETARGLVLKTNENEFKIFNTLENADLTGAYAHSTLKEYLENTREWDSTYVACALFDNLKEALTWLNDFN